METYRLPRARPGTLLVHQVPSPARGARHLLPPEPHGSDVRLDRLGPLLAAGGRERIVQIYGPTGLGKTTLLAGHVLSQANKATVFRWLTLHADDLASDATFQCALAEAVDVGAAMPGASLQPVARIEQAMAGRRLILVIDAGALDIEPAGRALGEVLRWTAEEFKVWLVSRRPCAAMLAEMRSPHAVRSIDPARLLFTEDEAVRHRDLAGVVTPAQPAAIEAQGWPLAEAIAIGLGPNASTDGLLDHAGGLLEASIRDGLWLALSSDARKALTETAMITWVDERFLARLLAPRPSYPVLVELDGLAPLAKVQRGAEGGFQVHPLLRAYAARQLELGDPDRKEQVYRQALAYHAERRSPEAAMELVHDSGYHALARMAFETFTSTELLGASGYNRVRLALSRLSPEMAAQPGHLTITQAVMAMKEGRFHEARRLLDTVREKVSEELAYQSPALSRVYADFVIPN